MVYYDADPANVDLAARLARDYVVSEQQLRGEPASKAGVTACGALVDLTNLRKYRHRGQRELADSTRPEHCPLLRIPLRLVSWDQEGLRPALLS